MNTLEQCDIKAKNLGAVERRAWRVPGYRELKPVFCWHYFNSDGLEVGFVHPDLGHRFLTLETPRPWHESFLGDLEEAVKL